MKNVSPNTPSGHRCGWGDTAKPTRHEIFEGLYCPFPETLNPHLEEAQKHTESWMQRFELLEPTRMARAARARMAWMVAGFYPTTSHLELAADYLTWAFALDDLGDETPTGLRPRWLSEIFEQFDHILRGERLRSGATSLEHGLYDIVCRLAKFAAPTDLRAFRDGNRAYFGGMLWEANNRAAGTIPDESSFFEIRPAAGAVPPFFALIYPFERIAIPFDLRDHSPMEEMIKYAGWIVCWVNDVLSYTKEKLHNDVHNLVMVYEHHHELPLGAAMSKSIDLCNAHVSEFIGVSNESPMLGEEANHQVNRLARVLGSMIRVTRDWTYHSTRYEQEVETGREAPLRSQYPRNSLVVPKNGVESSESA